MQLPRKGHNYEAQPSQCSETKRYGEQTMTKKHNSTVAITNIQIKADPANTLRDYNIVTTSLLRRYVFAGGGLMFIQRRINVDVDATLFQRYVPAGKELRQRNRRATIISKTNICILRTLKGR